MSQLIVSPGLQLAPFIDNFMVGAIPRGIPDIDLHFPASVRPRLILITRGSASLIEQDGSRSALPMAYVAGPKAVPRRYAITAGSQFIIAVFRAGCFTQFFDKPLNAFTRCVIALDDLVSASTKNALLERLQESRGTEQSIELLKRFLIEAREGVMRRHLHFLPRLTERHLAMTTTELASSADLSGRQFERRFLANYGMSLRDYRRLVRYMNALNLVLTRPWEHGLVTKIAQDSGYFDQAHFIRDFREFVGRAPGEFMKAKMAEHPENRFWRDGTYNIHG